MTYTNLAQSKVLVDLGLDPETADLTIISDAVGAYPHEGTRGKKEYPCWSAEALLGLLPRRVYEDEAEISDDIDDDDWVYALDIEKDEHSTWFIGYRHNAFREPQGGYEITACGELLAGFFAITEWLLKHKYL